MEFAEIESVAVVGAGRTGCGIAEVAALAGYEVTLRDVEEELVREGYERVQRDLEQLADRGRLANADARATVERIEPQVDVEAAVAGADVVVEAVPEAEEIKRDVYADLSRAASPETVLATSTDTHPVTTVSEMTDRPELVCGMHFFDPVAGVQLVEVVPGAHTTGATADLVARLAEAFGKTPIRVANDPPGAIVNRVLAAAVNEAAWLVEAGETVETVESTARHDLGLPDGLLELADVRGLDVLVAVLDRLGRAEGAAYEVSPALADRVEAGRLGRVTGRGFFEYDTGDSPAVPADAGTPTVERHLLATMANEVAKLVDAGVADVADVDEALVLGARFPDGPATLADDAGLRTLVETLEERREATGRTSYEPAQYLRERATAGGFYETETEPEEADVGLEHVRIEYPEEGVAMLLIDRAHELNTLSAAVVEELADGLAHVEDDATVRALVLAGSGEAAFAAGTDPQAITAAAAPLDAIEFARLGQRVLAAIEESDLPVVAAIEGQCLGGGLELAAAADLRIAGAEAELGLPDLEFGLMPGWGGTQRLPRIVGEGRATELVLTGDRYGPESMADYGFVNEVVPAGQAKARATDLAADLAAGPPVAQRLAKRAIHHGREDAEAGYEIEAQAFGHVAGTDDLTEGLAARRSGRDPEFEGE